MKKNKKIIIIGIIIIIIIIFVGVPNLIRLYNEKSKIDISQIDEQIYLDGKSMYNKASDKLYNLCVVNQDENIEAEYVLDKKYSSNPDYNLINSTLCYSLESDFSNIFDMDILNKKDYFIFEEQNQISNYLYTPPFHSTYIENVLGTKYEIIYNYINSVYSARERLNFRDFYRNDKISHLGAKDEIKMYYEKKLEYQYEDLKMFYNIFNYFELELNNPN